MIKILGTERYTKDEMDKDTPELIIRRGSGVDNLDLQECKNRDIPVINMPDIPANAVAEFTIGQILRALRYRKEYSRELASCTVGIFGYGHIGSLVKKKLASLCPIEVLVNDIDLKKPTNATKEKILTTCDIITLHIPLKDPTANPSYDNTNFISNIELELMKRNAIIVNMSRAGIINENALLDWATSNPYATAVLDVIENQDRHEKISKLEAVSNILITPHQAGTTVEVKESMRQRELGIINTFNNKKELYNRVI